MYLVQGGGHLFDGMPTFVFMSRMGAKKDIY